MYSIHSLLGKHTLPHIFYIRIMSISRIFDRYLRALGLFCFFFVLSRNAGAQVNIKVGYNSAFPQFNVHSDIIKAYQPEGQDLVEPFGSIDFLHGIQLGVRYRTGNTAFELGWENMSRKSNSLSFREENEEFIERSYSNSLSGLSAGIDNYFGSFGIGSAIYLQSFGIDRIVGNNDLKIVDETKYALRISFLWKIQQSDFVSFYVKPYYQFWLGEYDLTPLATDLKVFDVAKTVEQPTMFGISFVFYNGRQE